MANNYCQFSGGFSIKKDQAAKVDEIIARVEKEFEADENYGRIQCDTEIEPEGDKLFVWIHDNGEYGIPDHAEGMARAIIEELKIDKPFILSWAFTCSKPRIDNFGGGAFCIIRGKETFWVDAQNSAQLYAEKTKEE